MELTEREKRVVLELAEKGPLSSGETLRDTGKPAMNNTYWGLVKERLTDLDLITNIPRKGGGSSRSGVDSLWLTEKGVAYALLNEADENLVKLHALDSYRKSQVEKPIQIYFELREEVEPEIVDIIDNWMLWVGNVKPVELIKHLLPDLLMTTQDESAVARVLRIAKKYPEYWRRTEEILEKMSTTITNLKKQA